MTEGEGVSDNHRHHSNESHDILVAYVLPQEKPSFTLQRFPHEVQEGW